MDASLIAIGRRADTTNALSISTNQRASYSIDKYRSSEADGDQTERLASPATRRRSTSGGDEAAAMELGVRFQVSDFSDQPGTNASQGLFAATIPRPRVCRHGCRKTVRSRSQGRMSA